MSAAVVPAALAGDGRAFVESAMSALRPRGPDADGREDLPCGPFRVCLGHNRLSIIDLSPQGNQPMVGPGPLTIVYNGEVYNYRELRAELEASGSRFTTQSDTEVLLRAWERWGPEAICRFNGMFAFVLVDASAGEVVLVRDRFGVKPLHFTLGPDSLHVASTPEPLAHLVGRRPNLAYVMRGLVHRAYDQDDEACAYQEIRSVLPGHCYRFGLTAGGIELRQERYYDFASRVAGAAESAGARSEDDLEEETRALLTSACSIRTRSDVPVAVSLSGGLDSGTVALLASEAAPLKAISFASPRDHASEGPAVASTAQTIGIPVEYVWPSAKRMASQFWDCLRAQQAPFLTPSVVAQYAVFRRAQELGLKVLLGGQGGDEAFMGYRKYQLFALQAAWRAPGRPGLGRAALGLAKVAWAERGQLAVYARRGLQYSRPTTPPSLLDLDAAGHQTIGLSAGSDPRERQLLDVTRFSLPTLLRYEDRNSAGNSVESRLPFLDYRLLELAAALPLGLKLRDGFGKWVLRRIVSDRLPPDIVWGRAKRGFDVEAAAWIRAGLGNAIRESLTEALPHVRDAFRGPVNPARHFSDLELSTTPGRFGDAVTAVWLGTCL